MPKPLSIDTRYLTDFLVGLLQTPSPTGMTEAAIAYTESALKGLGFGPQRTTKGALVIEWPGAASDAPRALTAHADTLGAMVKEIKENGRLKLSRIGSYFWSTVEGEGCTVFTASGKTVRGSLLLTKASSHVHGEEVGKLERNDDNMEVRLDERTASAEETMALGVEVGDFVVFDPRVEVSPSGFIRSRHLDDKASVACILAAAQAMEQAGLQPAQRTTLHFSTHEEVGHGAASGLPADLADLVAVDMAAVGEGQTSNEFHATLCVKDSGGPYHADLSRRLRELAEAAGIPYKVDIYPDYGSDAEAYWRAGGAARIALIGPGVDASHSYERTHLEALVATSQWIVEYLRSE
jgi:putative aminopeptidase FrvX